MRIGTVRREHGVDEAAHVERLGGAPHEAAERRLGPRVRALSRQLAARRVPRRDRSRGLEVHDEHVQRAEPRGVDPRVHDAAAQRDARAEGRRVAGAEHGEGERLGRVDARLEYGHPRQERAPDPAGVGRSHDRLSVAASCGEPVEHGREQLRGADLLQADDVGVAAREHPCDPVELCLDARLEQVLDVERRQREPHLATQAYQSLRPVASGEGHAWRLSVRLSWRRSTTRS